MPQRDYVARSNKKKGLSKSLILAIIVFLLLAGGISLWVLKENAPAPSMPIPQQTQAEQPKGPVLPSRPEEVYSYIRDLETREVLKDGKQDQLSAEQKRQLELKKQEEAARLAAEQAVKNEANKAAETATAQAPTEAELAAQKAAEQQKAAKLAEEKRKQAELKKQELAKQAQTAEPIKATADKAALERVAAEKAKADQVKKVEDAKKEESAKIVATAAKPTDKAANQAGRFGLQCGAFKNKAQAENMQARLAMAGFNARINSSADWNRVVVGPVGDRAAASNAQANARSVAECVIVSM